MPAVATALAGALFPAPGLAGEDPATQPVIFSIDARYCPEQGVYGISYIAVQGAGSLRAGQNFIWNTQAAAVSITAVPPEGAAANVTVTYRCNVQVLWWQEAGGSQYATAVRWVNGTGPQPSYTLAPETDRTSAP